MKWLVTRVSLDDWNAVVDRLTRFGSPGEATADEGLVRVDFGSARITVTRGGEISAGMPLHGFERTGRAGLDHESVELTLEGEDIDYTFRRPGG